MSDNKRKERADKKRQQRARQALESFLTELRNACKTIERIEQWREHTRMLESIWREYEDALPAEAQARLHDAVKFADATREGFENACKVLQTKVESVIPFLPGTIAFGTVLIAALIVGAVAVGVASAYSAATTVTLTIENTNCGNIQVPPIPIPIPGLELPNGTIPSGRQAEAKIPVWVTLNVDATSNPVVLRTSLLSFPIRGNLLSIKLADSHNPVGAELLIPGQSTPVNLAGKTNSRLVVGCR